MEYLFFRALPQFVPHAPATALFPSNSSRNARTPVLTMDMNFSSLQQDSKSVPVPCHGIFFLAKQFLHRKGGFYTEYAIFTYITASIANFLTGI